MHGKFQHIIEIGAAVVLKCYNLLLPARVVLSGFRKSPEIHGLKFISIIFVFSISVNKSTIRRVSGRTEPSESTFCLYTQIRLWVLPSNMYSLLHDVPRRVVPAGDAIVYMNASIEAKRFRHLSAERAGIVWPPLHSAMYQRVLNVCSVQEFKNREICGMPCRWRYCRKDSSDCSTSLMSTQ